MTEQVEYDTALILMCKRPDAGTSKQRVARTAGNDIAQALAGRLLDCALADLSRWRGPTAIAIADGTDSGWAQSMAEHHVVLGQKDGNLGERIESVTRQATDLAPRQILIGMDAPTLNHRYLMQIARALQVSDLAFGHAEDGGVVAMGCNGSWPSLRELSWSTPQLGAQLGEAAVANGQTVSWFSPLPDIDHQDQFEAIAEALRSDLRPTRQALRQWLLQQTRAAVRAHSQTI
ncbi:MAG: DUF2064 domain-containing protein [Pseudomonadota bacterium]